MDSKEFFLSIVALISGVGLLLGVLMMFGTKYYLNHGKQRRRYIQLIWGVDNEWFEGRPFDFVMSNYVIPSSAITACLMNFGLASKRLKEKGSYAFPYLHRNDNYKILLREFPYFVLWEVSKAFILVLSLGLAGFGMGLDKGWW